MVHRKPRHTVHNKPFHTSRAADRHLLPVIATDVPGLAKSAIGVVTGKIRSFNDIKAISRMNTRKRKNK